MGSKNINTWYDINKIENMRKNIAYNTSVVHTNTSFGQKFLDYLDPSCFNSTNNESKNTICVALNCAKIIVTDWLFTNMDKF